jgi:hypothetical protein
MASPEYVRTVCSECGRRKSAGLQTDEASKKFWCFHCGKRVLPRVISLRMTPAQRRLRWIFYIAVAGIIIAVLVLALQLRCAKRKPRHTNAPGAAMSPVSRGGWGDQRRDAGSIGSGNFNPKSRTGHHQGV